MTDPLVLFVRESNRIEGIHREPTIWEIDAHIEFLETETIDIDAMQRFVTAVQPDAVLRDRPGLNVRVGNHFPPPGGLEVRGKLGNILWQARQLGADPFTVHRLYQNVHPFSDGNGRSGRALWLRMMGGPAKVPLGFLHTFYYQSLSDGDRS